MLKTLKVWKEKREAGIGHNNNSKITKESIPDWEIDELQA